MRVAVVGSSDESGLGSSFVRGARALGHDSTLIHAEDLVAGSRTMFLARRAHVERAVAARKLAALREALVHARPSIVVVVKGRFIPGHWLNDLRRSLSCPLINYYPDHPTWPGYSDPQIMRSLCAYDEVAVWAEDIAETVQNGGAAKTRVVPFGYDPELYSPPVEPLPARRDVALIGQWYPERLKYVREMADQSFLVSGRGWTRAASGTALAGRVGDDTYDGRTVCRIYWESATALNILAPWNAPSHNMRTFEIPASGTVMIATRTREHELLFGDDGAVLVSSPDEARSAVAELAHDDERRRAIATEGRRRVADHTYVDRVARLLEPWSA